MQTDRTHPDLRRSLRPPAASGLDDRLNAISPSWISGCPPPHWSVVICKEPITIEWAFFLLYRAYINWFRAITLSPSCFAMRYMSAPKRCRSTIEQVSKLFLRVGTHSTVKLRHIQMDCRVGGSRLGREPCGLSYITHLSGRIYRAYIQGFRAIALSCVSFAE